MALRHWVGQQQRWMKEVGQYKLQAALLDTFEAAEELQEPGLRAEHK